jgi:hypothetical protein
MNANEDICFLDVCGGMADWQTAKKLQIPSSREIPNSKSHCSKHLTADGHRWTQISCGSVTARHCRDSAVAQDAHTIWRIYYAAMLSLIGVDRRLSAVNNVVVPPYPRPRSTRSSTLVGFGRFTRLERLALVLEIWSFSGAWSLELGAWSYQHGCFCSKRINRAAGRPTRRGIFSPKHGLWSGRLRPTNLSNSVPPRGRCLGMNPIHSFEKNNSNGLQAGHALTVLPVLKSAHEA